LRLLGTRMGEQGAPYEHAKAFEALNDEESRHVLISYLRTLSGGPCSGPRLGCGEAPSGSGAEAIGWLRTTSNAEGIAMKNIKVLGSGCRNCEITSKVIAQAAKEAGVQIALEKVTDIAEIIAYGVMSTPGVVVDGKVVHAGGVPGPDQVRAWVRD